LFENQALKDFCIQWLKNNLKANTHLDYHVIITGFSAQSPQNRLFLWQKVQPFRPNVYLSYYYIFHPLPLTQICMVHDLIPLIYPDYFSKASLLFKFLMTRKSSLRWLIKQASHTLTVSNNTRTDLIQRLGIQASDISVISPGVSLFGTQVLENLEPGYILSVGRPDPHKNFAGLINAYAQLSKIRQGQHKLVLAGPQDKRYTPQLKQLVSQLKLNDHIIFTGSVPSQALPQLYQNACIFALPSLYEGFGLPIIEAMSYGTPVLTSNQGSMPEVSGKAALLINPEQPHAIARGLEQLLSDQNLAAQLAKLGKTQAQKFSWSKTATDLVQVLNKITQK